MKHTTVFLLLITGTSLSLHPAAVPLRQHPPGTHTHQPLPTFAHQPLAQAPGLPTVPGGMPELPPGVTPEQFEAALKEIDTFFNNMSEEEMKEFLNFVQDVESGKIDINELLPPGMMPPPGIKQAPPKPMPEAKPVAQPEVRPTPPKEPALRNKQAALNLLKNIIQRLSDIRVKAAMYDRVAQTLAPWENRLDTVTYYIHVIMDKEHVDRLVSNKELLPLHDALKELSELLSRQEPLIKIPEFGLGTIEKSEKEKSKKALREILAGFETFFVRQAGIAKLEQVMKLYEPELLKKRKEAEEAQERAQRDAQARAAAQPAPSRVRYEGGYGYPVSSRTGHYANGRFYDRYYAPEASYGRPATYERPSRLGSAPITPKPLEKVEKKEATPSKNGEGKDAPAVQAPQPTTKRPTISRAGLVDAEATRLISRIDNSFAFIHEALGQDIFQKELPTYLAIEAPASGEAVPLALEKAHLFNDELENMAQALHRIAKDRGALESRIKKLHPNMKAAYEQQLYSLFDSYQPRLKAVYDAGLNFEKKAYDEQLSPQLRNKITLHLGLEHKDVAAPYRAERNFSLAEFMDAYELAYEAPESEERKERKQAYEQRMEERKAAEEEKARKKAQRHAPEPGIEAEPEPPSVPEDVASLHKLPNTNDETP